MSDTDIIWTLLGIGYLFGFCLVAYFAITGTNQAINFQNSKSERLHNSFMKQKEGERKVRK